MYRLVKLSPVMFFIFIMSGIIAVIAAYVPNYEKRLYEKTSNDTTIVGYPAGDDITRVTSVEDIKKYNVFTVDIMSENIEQTYYYEQNGAISDTRRIVADRNNIINRKISYLFDSLNRKTYSQFCILALSNGEKVIVRLDERLLELKKGNKITLPIGEKVAASYPELFKKFQEKYDLAEENTTWYIEMNGSEWQTIITNADIPEKRDKVFGLTYFLSLIAISFILYKYAKKKLGDELE